MITNLKLRNFKCFKDEVDFPLNQITLLTGSNGRGKSSVLQSLLLISQSFENGNIRHLELDGKFLNLGNFSDLVFHDDVTSKKSFEIEYQTDDKEENDIKLVFKPYPGKESWARFDHLFVKGSNGNNNDLVQSSSTEGDDKAAKVKDLIPTTSISALHQLVGMHYIAAERNMPDAFTKKNDNFSGKSIGVHGELSVASLCLQGEDFVERLARCLDYILKGASLNLSDTNTDYLRFYLDSRSNSGGYRPVNVGFGYSYVLPVVLACMLADKNSKIIIENPEAHLHPAAQSRLMNFIIREVISKDCQVFIETHSDHVINALRIAVKNKDIPNPENAGILHFVRNDGYVSPDIFKIKIGDNGSLSDYPADFQDEWGCQMMQLV